MNDVQAKQFTYNAARKKCPSCGESLLLTPHYVFCEREHGTCSVPWFSTKLPEATRTARAGRFTIDGQEGFWEIPSHMDSELNHAGPPAGSVIAAIKRYHSTVPTAVVLVRKKTRPTGKPKPEVKVSRRPYGALITALRQRRLVKDLICCVPEPSGPGCLVPDCDCKPIARGLCKSCNNSAHILIAGYRTTWGELEDFGLARPLVSKKVRKVIIDQTFQLQTPVRAR